jgi:hypothetical protein
MEGGWGALGVEGGRLKVSFPPGPNERFTAAGRSWLLLLLLPLDATVSADACPALLRLPSTAGSPPPLHQPINLTCRGSPGGT